MTETGESVQEKHWNFEHKGDETKAELAVSAATTLTGKIKELFAADGLIAQVVEKAGRAQERGPRDYAERRRRPQYLALRNGDANEDSHNPLLAWIFALLLIILASVGVALHKLSNIEKGLNKNERNAIERPAGDGTPGELARRDL